MTRKSMRGISLSYIIYDAGDKKQSVRLVETASPGVQPTLNKNKIYENKDKLSANPEQK